jgi:hypothetical protein
MRTFEVASEEEGMDAEAVRAETPAARTGSLMIAGWAGRAEITQPTGRFHRCTWR